MSARRTLLYIQSGGMTAVINATAAGVIEAARARRFRVLAARGGLIGALAEDLIDTGRESMSTIRALRTTPGGAFGSSRAMPGPIERDPAPYERIRAVCAAHGIDTILYNGGNGSMDTAARLARLPGLTVIGIPKTIDNDIALTDTAPGFGSAAKYLATSIREAALDLASMAPASTRLFVLEVMGRNTGWLAAATGLAAERAGDAPQVILMPEVRFDADRFVAQVGRVIARDGWCAVVVAEGLRDAHGRMLDTIDHRRPSRYGPLGGIAPGIARIAGDRLGVKYHWAVASYLQRGARHLASAVDDAQAHACGVAAVAHAARGVNGVMLAIRRVSDTPYRWRIEPVPLARVANRERKVPRAFISTDGFHISARARTYLAPLIAGEVYPPFEHGLPHVARMRLVAVPQRLPAYSC